MPRHLVVLGSPLMDSLGWYWWTPSAETLVSGQKAAWLVKKSGVVRRGAGPELAPEVPAPRHPPLAVQLDRLVELGWEVLVSLSVPPFDEHGHAQVGVLMHLPTVGDRARLHA